MDLYYIPPSDKIFNEIKAKAIEVWQTYDNKFGYVDGKVGRIKDLLNEQDNAMYMVAMFDPRNQINLSLKLSKEANNAISDRLEAGGTPEEYNYFSPNYDKVMVRKILEKIKQKEDGIRPS